MNPVARIDLDAIEAREDEHYAVRVDVPALVAEVRRLRDQVAELEQLRSADIAVIGKLGVAVPRAEAERDAALARIAKVEARIAKIREWAYANHGGVKSPAEVWPGLAGLLAASPTPTGPERRERPTLHPDRCRDRATVALDGTAGPATPEPTKERG